MTGELAKEVVFTLEKEIETPVGKQTTRTTYGHVTLSEREPASRLVNHAETKVRVLTDAGTPKQSWVPETRPFNLSVRMAAGTPEHLLQQIPKFPAGAAPEPYCLS